MTFDEDYNKVKEIIQKAQEERGSIHKVKDLGFQEIKDLPKPPTIISQDIYSKKYDKKEILIILEYNDRCKTFMVRPDGIKVQLIAKEGDKGISKVDFRWVEKASQFERDE